MKKYFVLLSLIIACLLAFGSGAVFAWCVPATVPANPAPVSTGGSECLFKVLRGFSRGEETTKTLRLTQGNSYWFAANGCPRMGNINISIVNSNGEVVRESVGYSPSFCFSPDKDGVYTIKVKAVSLMNNNSDGNIDSCFSESGCQ